jgi:excisionase family DNA binding protein
MPEEEPMRTTKRMYSALIDVDEVAQRLGVSTRYVRRLVAERRIAYLKIGHLLRFDANVVDAWLEACEVDAYNGRGIPPTTRTAQDATSRSSDPRPAPRRRALSAEAFERNRQDQR